MKYIWKQEEVMLTGFFLFRRTFFLFPQLNKQDQLTKGRDCCLLYISSKIFIPSAFSFKYFKQNPPFYQLRGIINSKSILNTFITA